MGLTASRTIASHVVIRRALIVGEHGLIYIGSPWRGVRASQIGSAALRFSWGARAAQSITQESLHTCMLFASSTFLLA